MALVLVLAYPVLLLLSLIARGRGSAPRQAVTKAKLLTIYTAISFVCVPASSVD